MEGLIERLERAVTRLEQLSVTMQASGLINGDCVNGIGGDMLEHVEAFDVLMRGPVSEYMKHSQAIGNDVEKHAEMVHKALQTQRTFLKMTATHQQPAKTELHDLLKPISDHIQEIQHFREQNRGSSFFNHLSAVSESIPALGWVAVTLKPGPYVKEMNDAATFYTNRVLKDYKENDRRHVDWVRSYLSIWTEMQSYIKQHHCTGLEWSKTKPESWLCVSAAAPRPYNRAEVCDNRWSSGSNLNEGFLYTRPLTKSLCTLSPVCNQKLQGWSHSASSAAQAFTDMDRRKAANGPGTLTITTNIKSVYSLGSNLSVS